MTEKHHGALTTEEFKALPEKVREYIAALEAEVYSYRQTLQKTNDELRRKRFAFWDKPRY